MKNVVILGTGAVGNVIAKYLSNSPEISHIILADTDLKKLRETEEEISSDKFSIREVDASNYEQVNQVLEGNDIVINATIPMFNLLIMDACLAKLVHYVDLVTNRAILEDQLSRNDKFKNKDLVAVLGMGVSPGISNLFARKAADQLDRVESIIFRVSGSGNIQYADYPLCPGFSPRSYIEEWVEEPTLVYKNGEFKELPYFSGEEEWKFPDPIGPLKVFNCYHDEVDTIPRAYSQYLKQPRNIEFKYALSERSKDALILLKQLGLTKGEPIEVGGKRVVPIEVVAALLPDPKDLIGKAKGRGCITVEVQGEKGGKSASYIYYTTADNDEASSKYQTNFTAFLTGVATAILVKLMAKGLDVKGVILPHCIDPEPILEEYGKVCMIGEVKDSE